MAMTESPGPELYEAACAYAARGWAVFPCRERSKQPCKADGFFEHGVKEAKKSPYWLRQFWAKWPTANPALACGEESGVWVLDVDVKDGKPGWETLADLERLFTPLPATLVQDTPTGGAQFVFAYPGFTVKNSVETTFGPGLDTRGDGGYVMLPPSLHPDHPNGPRYRWRDDGAALAKTPEWMVRMLRREPEDIAWLKEALAGRDDVPAWLAKRLGLGGGAARAAAPKPAKTERLSHYARVALDDEVRRVRQALPGTQNDALNTGAFRLGQLVGSGALSEETVRQHLLAAALGWTIDGRRGPWKPEHLERIIASGVDAGKASPRAVPERETAPPAARRQGRHGAAPRRTAPAVPQDLAARVAAGRAVWALRQDLADTPAARWLLAKGVDPTRAGAWMGYAQVDYLWWERDGRGGEPQHIGRFPALLTGLAMLRPDGKPEVRGVLATYVTDDGRDGTIVHPATGEILPPRQLLGAWEGAAARLGRLTGGRLVLATGPAVALLSRAASPLLPVWVAGPPACLTRLSLPDAVRDVVVVSGSPIKPDRQHGIATALSRGGLVTVRFAVMPMGAARKAA